MKAIILYDALSTGGSTDRIIDAIGERLVHYGFYVEKAKTPPFADYSFLEEFDLVLIGSPIYNLALSPGLSQTLDKSNLLQSMKGKDIATFLICGGPELTAAFLYMPQLTLRLFGLNIVAQKIFGLAEKNNPESPLKFADEIASKTIMLQKTS
ncbi:MAG: protochlorophyllide oxidoreductase [Chloroherpetonaceae bacterium]|nr:protochlorophyllide oxidoreductase [Chloroherpetonaceae bacterium]